jgi:uncharacterized OB-fold protein
MTEQTMAQAETATAKPDALVVNQPQAASAPGQITRNLSGRGEVYSYTVMYNVPQGFEEQKPYVVALVKLAEGPLVTAQLTDVDHNTVTIGMSVEMVTRKLREDGPEGQIIYGYKFRPVLHKIA